MSNDMSYSNDDGRNVMTSLYLRSRKTCCKSGCLHCPYGYTLKKFGLTFIDYKTENGINHGFELENNWVLKSILLKDQIIGVMAVDHIQIKKLYLKERFRDQGLFKELIESYYF